MQERKLFTPVKIGPMEIKNRFVMPAMGTNLALHSGEVGDELISYYTERARGGFGLLILECCAVRYDGRSLVNECGLWDDSLIPSYERLTGSVHREGAKIAVQLRHCGRETEEKYTGGVPVLAPSKVPCPSCQSMPREMTTEEVYEMVQAFGDAAGYPKKSGRRFPCHCQDQRL